MLLQVHIPDLLLQHGSVFTLAQKQKQGIGLFFQHQGHQVQQEGLVFHRRQMAGMADDEAVPRPQLSPNGGALIFIVSKSGHIDAVEDEIAPLCKFFFTKEPLARLDAAAHQIGGAGQNQRPHDLFVNFLHHAAAIDQGGMGMGNAHRYSCQPGQHHGQAAVEHIVGVDYIVAMGLQNLPHLPQKCGVTVRGLRQMEDPAALLQKLLLISAHLIAEHNIVTFIPIRIGIKPNIPGHFFRAADFQRGGDDEYSDLVHITPQTIFIAFASISDNIPYRTAHGHGRPAPSAGPGGLYRNILHRNGYGISRRSPPHGDDPGRTPGFRL